MAKIRVHELAKELGRPSKEMVNTLQNLGLDVKNHMSTLEDSQASWVRKKLSGNTEVDHRNKSKQLRDHKESSSEAVVKPGNTPFQSQKHSPATEETKQRHDDFRQKPNSDRAVNSNRSNRSNQASKEQETRQQMEKNKMQQNNGATAERQHMNKNRPQQNNAAPADRQEVNRNRTQPSNGAPVDRQQTNRNRTQPSNGAPVDRQQTNRNRTQPSNGASVDRQQTNRNRTQPSNGAPADRQQTNRNRTQSNNGAPADRQQTNRNRTQPNNGAPADRQNRGQESVQGKSRSYNRNDRPVSSNQRSGQASTQPNKERVASSVRRDGNNVKDNRVTTTPSRKTGQFNDRPKSQSANGTADTSNSKENFQNNKKGPKKTVQNNRKPQQRKDYSRPQKKKHKKKKEETILQTPERISIGESIQVRELADMLGKGSAEIVKKLMELGTMVTINQEIDFDTVEILGSMFGVEVEHEIPDEQKLLDEIIDDEESLKPRSPIVTVMGHVDHGKTSLLDRIRKTNVVSGESGGITQHIGAYQVQLSDNKITFIDTPGHAAFTAMRARGANLTDIVVLVVAADDGVMPQTIEAINHIKAAKVPFLVALNKMDKPDVNPDRVMQQLTEYEIVPEEWGGDVPFIPVSAKTGMGIDNILEMLLLIAEMHELKANPDRPAEGVVIEAELDKGKGAVATVLVQKGTLHIGDYIVCGANWCKVRAMTDYRARKAEEAYPSMPVEITGWSDVPETGERVLACDEKIAKQVSSIRAHEKKVEEQKRSSKVTLDDFFKQMEDSKVKELNLIVKGDVQGSIEALAGSLLRLSTEEVKVNVIHSAAGAITETDVMLASASNAIIIGFNVRPDMKAKKHAELENIDIRLYRVIYEAINDVKKAMEGLLDPEYKEKYLGRAEVRATFKVPNVGTIAGSYVIDGLIQRNAEVRVLRDGVILYEGKLASLKRFKDDAKEVAENYECGIGIKDFNDIKEGDIIEDYVMEEIPRKL